METDCANAKEDSLSADEATIRPVVEEVLQKNDLTINKEKPELNKIQQEYSGQIKPKYHGRIQSYSSRKEKQSVTYYCLCCHDCFHNKKLCMDHMRQHVRNSTLNCQCCSAPHKGIKDLINHLRSQAEGSCLICNYKSLDKQEMEQHIDAHYRIYYPERKYQNLEKCLECNFRTADKNLMIIHRFNIHINPGNIITPEKENVLHKPGKTCNDCGKHFANLTGLSKHKRRAHNSGKLLFSCSYCEFRSDYPRALEKHQKKIHQNLPMMFRCAICNYITMKISSLKGHITSQRHIM